MSGKMGKSPYSQESCCIRLLPARDPHPVCRATDEPARSNFGFFIVFSFVGLDGPPLSSGSGSGISAHESGILPGDKVVRVEDVQVVEWEDMVRVIQPRAGIPTKITVERNGEELTFTVVPVDSEGVGVIGVRSGVEFVRLGVIEGIREGFRETFYVSVVWITGVFGMIVGKVAPEVTGPLGISQILGEAARHGLGSLLYLAGAISANLALINLLPIPALDGSRLFFVGIEAVRGKPIDPEKESFVHLVGFFLLMIAFLVVTYKDILRLMQ